MRQNSATVKNQQHQYREAVEFVRESIRRAPDGNLTLEEAADKTGMSAVRLHQVFAELHGENFGSFARRVRLEYACGLMRAFPNWTCTRVALEAGYSESSDFSRAFKRAFGLAPSRWNRVEPLNLSSPMLRDQEDTDPLSVDVACIGFKPAPDAGATPVAIRRREQEHLAVIAVDEAVVPQNLHNAFDGLERWVADRGQIRPGRHFMGLSYDSNLDTAAGLIRFELAYPVDGDTQGEGTVLTRALPERSVAVLPCRGGVHDFVAAWDYLLRVFLPGEPWRAGPGPQMEIYYNDPRRHGMQYWDMDCVIPVQREEEGTDGWQ